MAESAVSAESSGQPDDKELVVAFLDGDRGSFEQLVLRHQDRVFGLCFRLLGSRQAAEEAAMKISHLRRLDPGELQQEVGLMRGRMLKLAKNLEFEKAADLRDQISAAEDYLMSIGGA